MAENWKCHWLKRNRVPIEDFCYDALFSLKVMQLWNQFRYAKATTKAFVWPLTLIVVEKLFFFISPNSPSLQPTAVAAICDEKEEQKEDNYCEQHQVVKTRNIFRRYCNISNYERCLQQFVLVAKFDQTVHWHCCRVFIGNQKLLSFCCWSSTGPWVSVASITC